MAADTISPEEIRLYRPEEAAYVLRLSRSLLFTLLRNGRIRSVKERNVRLIPKSALDEYVALLEREAQEEANA